MVVVMTQEASEADIEAVCERVRGVGGEAFVSRGAVHTVIGLVGDTERFEAIAFTQLHGVDHVIRIGKPYKMVARDLHPEATTVKVGPTPVGRGTFTIIAGPCAVESFEQAMISTKAAKTAGATILRGDVYKPRTSPYSFQGLGERGLEVLAECRKETGLPIVVEVVDISQVEHVTEIADCIRVGTRNAQNFELLKAVGAQNDMPVLFKRGMGISLEDSLNACEYVASGGNHRIVFGLRGMKTNLGDPHRNFVDFAHVPVVKRMTRLPVCIDPSHSVGRRALAPDGLLDIFHVTAQAVIAGANMVLVDVHPKPAEALCDGPQALTLEELPFLLQDIAIARRAYEERRALARRVAESTARR
jgi:3-deoxy-7-phosphoheptulonate synthase